MNEDLVLHILNTACYGLNLVFSLIPQAPYLYIFFDRDINQSLDYSTLTETIRQAVVSSGLPPEYEYLALYSRILGNEEPDWETAIYLYSVPDSIAGDSAPEDVMPEDSLAEEIMPEDARSGDSIAETDRLETDVETDVVAYQEADPHKEEWQPDPSPQVEAIIDLGPEMQETIVLDNDDPADEDAEFTAPPIEAPLEVPPIVIEKITESPVLEADIKTDLKKIDPPADETMAADAQASSILVPPPPPAELMAPPPPLDDMAQFYFKTKPKPKPKKEDPVSPPPEPKTIVSISAKTPGSDKATPDKANPSTQPISTTQPSPEPPATAPVSVPQASVPQASVPQARAINLDEVDLSSYCFIRNRLLLTSQIKPPSGGVISVLKIFASFNPQEKQEATQLLDKLFRQPAKKENEEGSGEAVLYQVGDVDVKNLVEPLQSWVKEVMDLDPESFRKSAIWFSRYCHNPQGTIAELGLS